MIEVLPYYTLFYEPAELVQLAQHTESNYSAHLQVLATRREGKNMPHMSGRCSKKGPPLLSTVLWSLTLGRIENALCPPDKATKKKVSFVVMDLLTKV